VQCISFGGGVIGHKNNRFAHDLFGEQKRLDVSLEPVKYAYNYNIIIYVEKYDSEEGTILVEKYDSDEGTILVEKYDSDESTILVEKYDSDESTILVEKYDSDEGAILFSEEKRCVKQL